MKMKLAIASLLVCVLDATSAYACDSDVQCDVKQLTGEIPCVTLSDAGYDCMLTATSTCPPAELPTLTLDNGVSYDWRGDQVSLHVGFAPPEGATRTISWTRGEERGEATLRVTRRPEQQSSDPFDFSSCSDTSCAATPPQRPAAPLTALLPLLLSALIWRRRTTPQGAQDAQHRPRPRPRHHPRRHPRPRLLAAPRHL